MSFSFLNASTGRKRVLWLGVIVLGVVSIWAMLHGGKGQDASGRVENESSMDAAKPALTVTAITPQTTVWPHHMVSNGSVAAWQEAVISTEIGNLRLMDVRVNVGDSVKQGQLLARISNDTLTAELAQSRASVSEAEAMLAEARANGDRARQYQQSGFMSAQQITQYLTAEQAALARLTAAQARMQTEQLRLDQTYIRAPDSGIISARTATIGSLAQPGQELFRLIRGGRLEWRAEVSAADLDKLKPGMIATLIAPDGQQVQGRVRMVAPTVDPQTLNGLVYVDLPAGEAGGPFRAGSFARGEFAVGDKQVLSLPQSAVVVRDGFAYVFSLDGAPTLEQTKVTQIKVALGQRKGDLIEIAHGLQPDARVVASGAAFLADGDTVRVVASPASAQQ